MRFLMNKKEVAEIKRRFKKESCSFTRMCGCYVNSSKEKLVSFGQTFLNLEDEEFHKYLEIANKTLSGTIGNNLLELEFPMDEEINGGRQQILMGLRESELKDDGILQRFYDHVIESYDYVGNYLILLFHDSYDIPMKTTDKIALDDSEEVYDYILCAICPVNLSKPGLGYQEDENRIAALMRDWVVGATDTGFTFPAFTERSADIHHVLVYAKNPKEPHKEFWEQGLGCESKYTSAEKKAAFQQIVTQTMGPDNEETPEIILDIQQNINDFIETKSEIQDKDEPVILNKKDVIEILEDTGIPEHKCEKISEKFDEFFAEEMPDALELLDSKALKNNELRTEKKEFQQQVIDLTQQLEDAGIVHNANEDSQLIVKINPDLEDDITSTFVDGIHCLLIPITDVTSATINGKIQEF